MFWEWSSLSQNSRLVWNIFSTKTNKKILSIWKIYVKIGNRISSDTIRLHIIHYTHDNTYTAWTQMNLVLHLIWSYKHTDTQREYSLYSNRPRMMMLKHYYWTYLTTNDVQFVEVEIEIRGSSILINGPESIRNPNFSIEFAVSIFQFHIHINIYVHLAPEHHHHIVFFFWKMISDDQWF